MNNYPVKITYEEGSTQVINVSPKFDGDYYSLVHDVAQGKPCTFKVLKPEKGERSTT